MDEQLYALDSPNDTALTLKTLVQVIDDPRVRARTRMDAVRALKKQLVWLKRLIEAPETAPVLRREIIEALRTYRRS
jgi:hypothetical protein